MSIFRQSSQDYEGLSQLRQNPNHFELIFNTVKIDRDNKRTNINSSGTLVLPKLTKMHSPQSRLPPDLIDELRGTKARKPPDGVNANILPISPPRRFGERMFSLDNIEPGSGQREHVARYIKVDLASLVSSKRHLEHNNKDLDSVAKQNKPRAIFDFDPTGKRNED